MFSKLAKFEPLCSLTGKDEEWNLVHGDDIESYQNRRNSAVFKNGKEGKPYYIDAFVMQTQNGNRFGGSLILKDGRRVRKCYIKDFSNMPTIVINVLEKEIAPNDWEMWLEDESQLRELEKYYDFEKE